METRRDWTVVGSGRRAGVVVAVAVLIISLFSPVGAGPAAAVAGPVQPANLSISVPAGKINPFGYSATGAGPIQWSASGLPAGLTLDPVTGLLSGRALTAQAATTYTIMATDTSDGTTSTTSLTIAIQAMLLPPAGSVVGTVGTPLSTGYTFVPEGFIAPTFTLGAHPAWLGIDINGNLTGTPDAPAAPFTLTVTATDATGLTAVASVSVSVLATALTPPSQTIVGKVGSALAPAGASFPTGASLAYSTTPDIVAATGLTFSTTTGAITGIPTKAIPATTFVVQQRNTTTNTVMGESTASVQVDGFLGVVATPITVSVGADLPATVPFPASAAAAAGLLGTVTYGITPALPTGLILDPISGSISGIPTVAASRDYTITATDSRSVRAAGTVTIAVTAASTTLSVLPATQSITGAVATNLQTASLVATGSRSTVTYTISPIQPGGLVFDSATGSLSGIPTEAVNGAVYTITATDTLGAKGTSKLTLTITRTSLSVPVIGSVVGGPEIGSLMVYFAKPSSAPAGQQYTIQVSDATGTQLITSWPTTTSPTTITGLVGGVTYSVVVLANASASFDAVESLPKTGTASATATVQTTSQVAAGTVTNLSTLNSTTSSSTTAKKAQLAAAGLTVPSGSQAAKVSKILSAKPPTRRKVDAPKIHVPLNTNLSIVLSGVTVKDKLEVWIKVKKFTFVSLGVIKAEAGTLTVPTIAGSKPGMHVVRFSPKGGGAPGYIKVVFDKPKGSSSSSSSSSSPSSADGF